MFQIANQYLKKLDKTNLSNYNLFKCTTVQLDSGFKIFFQWITTEKNFLYM